MVKFLKKLVGLFKHHYSLFLVFVVLISYGQMLGMYVWQDDNALFFKLAHINEPAGYFAPGPIGTGIEKYAALPFIPIHFLFGFNTVFYFAFLLTLYIIVTLLVYRAFSVVLGKTGGKVAGFIFGAGYVASDGFWRMSNSAITSIGLIFTSLILLSYWKYYRKGGWFWYFLALVFFFLAEEIAILRTNYLFAVIVLLELLFLTFRRPMKSIALSTIRLLPFLYIYYNWALAAAAGGRASAVKEFGFAFLRGKLDLYYGYVSTVGNLVIPDWLTKYLFLTQKVLDNLFKQHMPLLTLALLALPIIVAFLLLKNQPKKKILFIGFVLLSVAWLVTSQIIFDTTLAQPTAEQSFIASLGGFVILLGVLLLFILKKEKRLFLLFSLWLLINLVVYSANNPTFQHSTVERYIVHSFFALAGIFGLLFTALPKKRILGNVGRIAIVLLGVGNLIHAVLYQNMILNERSFPAKQFYKQLKVFLPNIKKGDVLYFDIARDAQHYYDDAVATAMMPETTAFAWRYGIDRYDLKLITDFQELVKVVHSENVLSANIHTFWYPRDGLVDTTGSVLEFFEGRSQPKLTVSDLPQISKAELTSTSEYTFWRQPDLSIPLQESLSSIVPLEITLEISALPISDRLVSPLLFPYTRIPDDLKAFWSSVSLRQLALEYKKTKEEMRSNSQFSASSEWQNNLVGNLHDRDLNSLWQSERTGWGREHAFVEVKLPTVQEIDRAVWINGFSQNTPTKYSVEVSLDGQSWQEVRRIESPQRVDNREPQVIAFSPVKARYVKMVFRETISGDSPIVAEFWVIPSRFSELDLGLAERFLREPFWYVPSAGAFTDTVTGLGNKSRIQLVWQSDKRDDWQSLQQTEFEIYYDGQPRIYKVVLPAGGTQISKLKITNISMPGTINLHSVDVRTLLPQEVSRKIN